MSGIWSKGTRQKSSNVVKLSTDGVGGNGRSPDGYKESFMYLRGNMVNPYGCRVELLSHLGGVAGLQILENLSSPLPLEFRSSGFWLALSSIGRHSAGQLQCRDLQRSEA